MTLDDDVYRIAQALSEQTRTSLGTVLSRLVRKGLSRGSEKLDDMGLPGFMVSEDTPSFGPEEVARAEEEW